MRGGVKAATVAALSGAILAADGGTNDAIVGAESRAVPAAAAVGKVWVGA